MLACTPSDDGDSGSSSVDVAYPNLRIVAPAEGETVPGGEVSLTVELANATLATAHWNDGDGGLAVAYSVDGLIVLFVSEYEVVVDVEPGTRVLGAELWWDDGDPFSPPATDEVTVTVVGTP